MNNNIIKSINDEGIVKMCNEILEWKNSGTLNHEGLLHNLYINNIKEFSSIKSLEDEVIIEAHSRFKNVLKLLFLTNPSLYIK